MHVEFNESQYFISDRKKYEAALNNPVLLKELTDFVEKHYPAVEKEKALKEAVDGI